MPRGLLSGRRTDSLALIRTVAKHFLVPPNALIHTLSSFQRHKETTQLCQEGTLGCCRILAAGEPPPVPDLLSTPPGSGSRHSPGPRSPKTLTTSQRDGPQVQPLLFFRQNFREFQKVTPHVLAGARQPQSYTFGDSRVLILTLEHTPAAFSKHLLCALLYCALHLPFTVRTIILALQEFTDPWRHAI